MNDKYPIVHGELIHNAPCTIPKITMNPEQSKTPKTVAELKRLHELSGLDPKYSKYVETSDVWNFARQLERERNQARAEVETQRDAKREYERRIHAIGDALGLPAVRSHAQIKESAARLRAERDEARAVLKNEQDFIRALKAETSQLRAQLAQRDEALKVAKAALVGLLVAIRRPSHRGTDRK